MVSAVGAKADVGNALNTGRIEFPSLEIIVYMKNAGLGFPLSKRDARGVYKSLTSRVLKNQGALFRFQAVSAQE
jgi:hypothetical protein